MSSTPKTITPHDRFDLGLGSTGDLNNLPVSDSRVGDEIIVTGSEWTNIAGASVRFYLLTEEQTVRPVMPRDLVKLGEVIPAEDGSVSFRFRLAESYQRPNGDDVRIEAGQQWYIAAYQDTEPAPGLSGSHGVSVGPLTVVE